MQFHFSSIDRAKSAARRLQTVAALKHGVKLPLTQWQNVLARLSGAIDWKALSRSIADYQGEPDLLDHQLPDFAALAERRIATVRALMRLLHENDDALDLAEDVEGLGELVADAEPTGNGNGPFIVYNHLSIDGTPTVYHRLPPLDRSEFPFLTEFPVALKRSYEGRLVLKSCQEPKRWRELARRIPITDDFDCFYGDEVEEHATHMAADPGAQMIEWDGEVVGYLQLVRFAPFYVDANTTSPSALLRRNSDGQGVPEAASHLVTRLETLYVLPQWRQVENFGRISCAVFHRIADIVFDDAVTMASSVPAGDIELYFGGEVDEGLVRHVVHSVGPRVREGLFYMSELPAQGPTWNGRQHPAERIAGPFDTSEREFEADSDGPTKPRA